jgi:hypothetical protein
MRLSAESVFREGTGRKNKRLFKKPLHRVAMVCIALRRVDGAGSARWRQAAAGKESRERREEKRCSARAPNTAREARALPFSNDDGESLISGQFSRYGYYDIVRHYL